MVDKPRIDVRQLGIAHHRHDVPIVVWKGIDSKGVEVDDSEFIIILPTLDGSDEVDPLMVSALMQSQIIEIGQYMSLELNLDDKEIIMLKDPELQPYTWCFVASTFIEETDYIIIFPLGTMHDIFAPKPYLDKDILDDPNSKIKEFIN